MLVLAATAVGPGCTHWGTTTTYGDRREVGRRMLGTPQVAQTSSSSMSAGFAGGSATTADGRRTSMIGGLSGNSGSMTRTHCVQAAEIEYEQGYQTTGKVQGRPFDIAGGVILGVIGFGTMLASKEEADFENQFGDSNASAGPGLAIGGAMVVGGIGWIWYATSRLPKGPPPTSQPQVRRWTATEFVEATGCGLVPGDQDGPRAVQPVVPPRDPRPPATTTPTTTAPGARDTAARLKKLEELRAAGLITESEYQTKRKAVLDEL